MKNKLGLILILIVLLQIVVVQITSFFGTTTMFQYFKYIYTTTVYLSLSALIWIERENLEDFHLERLTLYIFIFSSLFRRRLGVNGEEYFLLVIGLTGISTIVAMFVNKSRIRIPKTNSGWVLTGLLVGIIGTIPISLIQAWQSQLFNMWPYNSFLSDNISLDIVRQIIYDLSFASLIEEMLFRGFIWGYLRKLGWAENRAFWVQGILFWVSHFGRLRTPLTFLLSIPLATFIYSKLTLRSKQVFPSVVSHLIVNVATLYITF